MPFAVLKATEPLHVGILLWFARWKVLKRGAPLFCHMHLTNPALNGALNRGPGSARQHQTSANPANNVNLRRLVSQTQKAKKPK